MCVSVCVKCWRVCSGGSVSQVLLIELVQFFLVKPAFTDFYFIFYFFPGTCGQQREEAADMKQKLHQLRG